MQPGNVVIWTIWNPVAGLFEACGNIRGVSVPREAAERRRRDAEANTTARAEVLRLDVARSLGENLEQANALIRAAYALANGFSVAGR